MGLSQACAGEMTTAKVRDVTRIYSYVTDGLFPFSFQIILKFVSLLSQDPSAIVTFSESSLLGGCTFFNISIIYQARRRRARERNKF